MLRKDQIPDPSISQRVSQLLSNRGMRPPCQINVQTSKGNVTLSGKIQYEHQRRIVMQTARNVEGVMRVTDQLQVIPQKKHWA